MDVGTSVGTSKRQKICKGQNKRESEDRITHLPDNVLQSILSFLPTKYAVVTSVLSTRWKHLWTSIHNFDFCDSQVYTGSKTKSYSKRKTLFRDFVYRVLLLTDVSDINKFSLACKACDVTHFNKWIHIVTRRKVKELVISITNNSSRVFLNWILSCQSIRILKIHMEGYIKLPASVCFSSLKVLHLKFIDFSSDHEVQEVSLSFPILEELVISYCSWLKIKTVNIAVPTIRMLTIEDHCRNVLRDCEIKIDAERLVSLKFKSDFVYNYSLRRLSSLVDASIDISHRSETVRVGSFLREISNVRDLELSVPSIETLADPAISADVCSLSRLIHLRLARCGRSCVSGRTLIDLLCIMPKFETIAFPDGPVTYTFDRQTLGTTPQCFLSHLKLVDIGYFGVREIWFVNFWIKSVKVIGNLTIKLRRCSGELAGWKEQITRQLDIAKYPNCILQFC